MSVVVPDVRHRVSWDSADAILMVDDSHRTWTLGLAHGGLVLVWMVVVVRVVEVRVACAVVAVYYLEADDALVVVVDLADDAENDEEDEVEEDGYAYYLEAGHCGPYSYYYYDAAGEGLEVEVDLPYYLFRSTALAE